VARDTKQLEPALETLETDQAERLATASPATRPRSDLPFGRFSDAAEDLEKSALASPVSPDNTNDLTFFDVEIQVPECPELLDSSALKDLLALQHLPSLARDVRNFPCNYIAQCGVRLATLALELVRDKIMLG
jgi:hypothetical protein